MIGATDHTRSTRRRRHRRLPRLTAGSLALALLLTAPACTEPKDDEVVIDDGTIPPEATASTGPDPEAPTDETTPETEPLGPPTLSDSSAITTAGIDDVAFGMSVEEAERAAGARLVAVEGEQPEGCYHAELEEGPSGLQFTVVDGTVERLDVTSGALATRSGAGIGDTTAQLRELFPDQLDEGADPDGSGQVLTYVPTDESDLGTLIIFEIEGDQVARFRSGRTPTVNTGC